MSLASHPSARSAPRPSSSRLTPAAAYVAVVDRLQATRKRILRWTVAAICFSLAAIGAAVFGTLAVVDWAVELNGLSRGLFLVGLLSATGWGLTAAWRRWIAPYSLERAAIDVEGEIDEFGQGLRTALDYQEAAARDFSARPAAALPALVDALHQETYDVGQSARWDEVGPQRWLWRSVLACLVIGGTALLGLAIVPELRIAAGRMLLLPWQYTQVTYEPHQAKIKHGESVLIKAEITGRPIRAAELRYRTKGSGDWMTVELLPPERTGEFLAQEDSAPVEPLLGVVQTKLTNLQADVEFEVLAGPVKLPLGNIRVLQPLLVKSVSAKITPPSYTKRPVATVETRDFKVWEGSHVELQIALNRPAATAAIKRLDGDASQDKPAAEAAPVVSGSNLQFDLNDLRRGGTFEVTAAAEDEMELKPLRFKIAVTLDRKPTVKWIQPEEQWEVTPTTEVTMAIAAEDDLGVHKAGIAWQIGSGELKTLWETDALGAEQSLSAVAALLLEEHELTHRDSITYYAFAEDNYFDQPRRTTTPLRFIDIRPYQQDYQLPQGGGGGGGSSGQSVTLEELIKRQRDQLNQSFSALDPRLKKEALQKLAAAQADLKEHTSEFAEGMAQLGGDVEPLGKAAEQMQAAADKLNANELDPALNSQMEALALLVKARENLRKKLCNCSSDSPQKKFDRQQRQKLRLPEQKKQDQQQQLAQTKKKLDDLAQREREWSSSACQACQNASSKSNSQGQSQSQQQEQKEALAKSQEEMLKELAELQKQIAQDEAAGKSAQEQAARAAEAMEKSLAELKKNAGDGAKEKGEQAADRLDQLAAHLAAMNQQDVGQRLNQAQKDAVRIAGEQEQLAKEAGQKPGAEGKSPGDLAEKQGDLAQQAKMLAEVLEKLRQDAKGDKGPAGAKLEQIAAEQQPGEIAQGMERTAADLKAGKQESGRAGVNQAKDELNELAQALGAARRELSQPQLQELIKLEEQLAQLREQAQKGDGQKPGEGKPGSQSAGAAEKWDQLQERLHELAESDKRLEGALRKLGGNAQLKPGDKLRPSEFQQNTGAETPPGHYSWDELGNYQGLDDIAKVLQTKIQEAILAGALQDANEPVPPEYKALVEKYYRTLSDDLR